MRAVLTDHLDYIFFVYGLAFFLLGGICLANRRHFDDVLPWRAMGLFGLAHGINEWLDLAAMITGDSPAFSGLRTAIMALSFLCLVEFGRIAWERQGRPVPRWWLIVPLALAAGLAGHLGGPAGLNGGFRIFFGLTGCLWSAAALAGQAHRHDRRRRRWLLTATAGMVLYGISAGAVIPASPVLWGPWINHASVMDTLGMPIQLFRAAFACTIAVAVWGYDQGEFQQSILRQRRSRHFALTLATLAVTLGGGLLLTDLLGAFYRQPLEREAQADTMLVVERLEDAGLEMRNLAASLSGSPILTSAPPSRSAVVDAALDRYATIHRGSTLFLLDRDGTVIASSNRDSADSFVGRDFSAAPYFRQAWSGTPGRDLDLKAGSGEVATYGAAPVVAADGRVTMVLAVEKTITAEELNLGRAAHGFVVDAAGNVLLAGRADEPSRLWPSPDAPGASALLSSKVDDGDWPSIGSTRFLAGRHAIGDSRGWSVVVLEPGDLARLARLLAIAATALISCGIVVSLLMIQREMASSIQLGEARQNLDRILSSAGEGICGVDLAGAVTFANAAARRMLGWGDLDVRGMDLHSTIHHHVPDGRPYPADECPLSRVLTPDAPPERVHVDDDTYWTRSGDPLPVEVTISPILDNGKVSGAVTVFRDISERKQAAAERRRIETDLRAAVARLRLVVDTTAEGIVGIDDERRVTFANRAAATILGWPSLEAVQGRPMAEVIGHRLPDGTPCAPGASQIAASLEDGQTRRVVDEYFVGRSSTPIPVEYAVAPLVVSDIVVGGIIAFHDTSERKALEEELRRSNQDLEQFAYVASHDLRQPLRMIGSYLNLLARRLGPALDEDGKEFLGYAVTGARRMDALILDLLDYARVGRDKAVEMVPLHTAIAEAVHNLTAAIDDAGGTVAVTEDLPTVRGNRLELMRLFQNLIGNALKYRAPQRAPHVTVECRDTGEFWEIEVKDNGIGIAPEFRERVFGIFQRLVAADEVEGTGIGLAVCKKIVERHGGRIAVESTPGEGSRFLVTLPKEA